MPATSAAVRNIDAANNDQVKLAEGGIWRLEGDNRWRMIICTRGKAWVTQERDLEDYVLMPGDVFLVTQPGKVLIGALCDAAMEITPSLRKAPYCGRYPLRSHSIVEH